MKHKNKRLIIMVAIVGTLAFVISACTSPATRQAEQQASNAQQSITLRVIELISEGKL